MGFGYRLNNCSKCGGRAIAEMNDSIRVVIKCSKCSNKSRLSISILVLYSEWNDSNPLKKPL